MGSFISLINKSKEIIYTQKSVNNINEENITHISHIPGKCIVNKKTNMRQSSGKIIDNEIIEYNQVINYKFHDVLPHMTTEKGITHIKFIGLDTRHWCPISDINIYETFTNGSITLHVSLKK